MLWTEYTNDDPTNADNWNNYWYYQWDTDTGAAVPVLGFAWQLSGYVQPGPSLISLPAGNLIPLAGHLQTIRGHLSDLTPR